MKNYLSDVKQILDEGVVKTDRTGTGTISVIGQVTRFNLKEGLPVVTSRLTRIGAIVKELIWFLRGDTSQRALKASGCSIWDEWADDQGRLGPVYGAMWTRRPAAVIDYEVLRLPSPIEGVTYVNKQQAYEFAGAPCETPDDFVKKMVAKTPTALSQVYTIAFGEWVQLLGALQFAPDAVMDERWLTFANFLDDFTTLGGNEIVGTRSTTAYINRCNTYSYRFDREQVCFIPSEMQLYGKFAHEKTIEGGHLEKGEYIRPRFYINQIAEVLTALRNKSDSRRIIVDGWEPSLLPISGLAPKEQPMRGRQALPPCHTLFQFFVNPPVVEGGKHQLSLILFQRSKDTCVGASYNIASYAIMVELFAKMTDLEASEIIIAAGDCHIYSNHIENAKEQITRETFPLPKLTITGDISDLYKLTPDQFVLEGYEHGPAMSYPIAV